MIAERMSTKNIEAAAKKIADIFIASLLKEPLLHGDEKHRAWLSDELRSKQPDLEKLISAGFSAIIHEELR